MHRTTLRNCSSSLDMHHTCTIQRWEIVLVCSICTIHAPYMHRTFISKNINEVSYLTVCMVHVCCIIRCMYGAFWQFCTVQIVCYEAAMKEMIPTYLTHVIWKPRHQKQLSVAIQVELWIHKKKSNICVWVQFTLKVLIIPVTVGFVLN